MTRSTVNPASHYTAPRLFVAAELREGIDIMASAAQAHYLGTVLRRGPGDVVRLFNGKAGEWLAHVGVSRRDRLSLTVADRLRAQAPEGGPWLVFALLKRDATDIVVRQAVELGASRILPVVTERTNAARVNAERLDAIAVEAAEQSERLTVPAIDPLARLDAVLAAWPAERHLFAALERTWSEAGAATARPHPQACPGLGNVTQARRHDAEGDGPRHAGTAALLVGPEGGFTPAEREMLRRFDFVTPISLGPLVLRAETAAAAGQALLLAMGWA